MKRILETLKLKWPEYLLEILVLIIGIYGAFAVDNWNKNRIERNLETNYLKSIHADLSKDIVSLEFMYNHRKSSSTKAYEILQIEKVPNNFTSQFEFSKILMETLWWWEFIPNDNTFQELINSGNLNVIQNGAVKNGLFNLEAINDEIIKQRDHMRRDYEHYLYDEIFKLDQFDFINFDQMLKSREVTYLDTLEPDQVANLADVHIRVLANKKVRNGWKLIILNNSFMLKEYDKMKVEIELLLNEIDKQLAKKD